MWNNYSFNSKTKMNKNKYHLAVIGAGAAGLIAAGKAGELGADVVLLEKNKQSGVKLLITGKGRCNITNAEENLKKFAEAYGSNGRFFRTALYNFTNQDVIRFFEDQGLDVKTERGNRVFPQSDKAKDVVECLKRYTRKGNVQFKPKSELEKIVLGSDNKIEKLILKSGETIVADAYLLATGGKSYPATGSTGDAYAWLKGLGHTIVEPRLALCPVILKERFVSRLNGLNLRNVEVSLM